MSPKLLLNDSAMVNWNRRLLIQEVTIILWYLFMYWATALVYLVTQGTPGAKGAANKQDLAKRLKLRFIHMMSGINAAYDHGSAIGSHDTIDVLYFEGKQ